VSSITSTSVLFLAVILVSGCQAAAVSDPAQIETVSIKEARGMSIGERVRVSGTVTVQSGALVSSISSGFALQYGKAFIDDSSGECQIFVNVSTGLVDNARDWKVGDFISVIDVTIVGFHTRLTTAPVSPQPAQRAMNPIDLNQPSESTVCARLPNLG
jgi:hypothetical protein